MQKLEGTAKRLASAIRDVDPLAHIPSDRLSLPTTANRHGRLQARRPDLPGDGQGRRLRVKRATDESSLVQKNVSLPAYLASFLSI